MVISVYVVIAEQACTFDKIIGIMGAKYQRPRSNGRASSINISFALIVGHRQKLFIGVALQAKYIVAVKKPFAIFRDFCVSTHVYDKALCIAIVSRSTKIITYTGALSIHRARSSQSLKIHNRRHLSQSIFELAVGIYIYIIKLV